MLNNKSDSDPSYDYCQVFSIYVTFFRFLCWPPVTYCALYFSGLFAKIFKIKNKIELKINSDLEHWLNTVKFVVLYMGLTTIVVST